jgi:hypothetical protein
VGTPAAICRDVIIHRMFAPITLKGILGVLAALGITLPWFFNAVRKPVWSKIKVVWNRVFHPIPNLHSVDLRLVPERFNCFWLESYFDFEASTHVQCVLNVTNAGATDRFQILDAFIRKPKTHMLMPPGSWGHFQGRAAHRITLRFDIIPPATKSGESFAAKVVLIDQFNKPHETEKITFRAMGGPGWKQHAQQQKEMKEARLGKPTAIP